MQPAVVAFTAGMALFVVGLTLFSVDAVAYPPWYWGQSCRHLLGDIYSPLAEETVPRETSEQRESSQSLEMIQTLWAETKMNGNFVLKFGEDNNAHSIDSFLEIFKAFLTKEKQMTSALQPKDWPLQVLPKLQFQAIGGEFDHGFRMDLLIGPSSHFLSGEREKDSLDLNFLLHYPLAVIRIPKVTYSPSGERFEYFGGQELQLYLVRALDENVWQGSGQFLELQLLTQVEGANQSLLVKMAGEGLSNGGLRESLILFRNLYNILRFERPDLFRTSLALVSTAPGTHPTR